VVDPLDKVRVYAAAAVIAVWVVFFFVILFLPERDHLQTAFLGVQAAAMLVLGALFADRIKRGKR
jgi:uncharacterized BrkB/YihY/UPF0761 family membrane protein